MNQLHHVLIIPDGNRRWARKNSKEIFLGHHEGAKNSEAILRTALELKIPYLTFWGTSLDNVHNRSKVEVTVLFEIFEKYFARLIEDRDVHRNKARIQILGRWRDLFPENLKKIMEESIAKTKSYDNYHLTFLMAYDGQDEMTEAIKKIAEEKIRNRDLEVTGEVIKSNLWTADLPAVDLIIRTGGEPHLSGGLMMWDVANAQLYFTDTLWPDFSPEEFKKAVATYAKTERRMGR